MNPLESLPSGNYCVKGTFYTLCHYCRLLGRLHWVEEWQQIEQLSTPFLPERQFYLFYPPAKFKLPKVTPPPEDCYRLVLTELKPSGGFEGLDLREYQLTHPAELYKQSLPEELKQSVECTSDREAFIKGKELLEGIVTLDMQAWRTLTGQQCHILFRKEPGCGMFRLVENPCFFVHWEWLKKTYPGPLEAQAQLFGEWLRLCQRRNPTTIRKFRKNYYYNPRPDTETQALLGLSSDPAILNIASALWAFS